MSGRWTRVLEGVPQTVNSPQERLVVRRRHLCAEVLLPAGLGALLLRWLDLVELLVKGARALKVWGKLVIV